jgi:Subtilase family
MDIEMFKHRLSQHTLSAIIASTFGLLLILGPLLASCGAVTPLEFVPIDLGIPVQALNSPVVGPLPDSTKLHVRITFKVSQNIINKLDGQQVHPGQPSKLEELANKIGIDDATYQKIKGFFNLQGIALNLSKLDIEMVAGLARSINIVDYQTDGNSDGDIWTQVNDELQQILNDNTRNANAGDVVSISLGAAEGELTAGDRNAIDQSLQLLSRAEHMRVFIASGDCGAFSDRVFNSLSVSFPASDPWATSVGGTILSIDNQLRRVNEVVWSDRSNPFSCKNRWGSGGGNSRVYPHPGWQDASGVNNRFSGGNHRQIPDVSAAAFALAVYFEGQWGAVGGTSAAAPMWAAGLELINQGLIQQIGKFTASPQLFYMVAQGMNGMHPYFDVTRGNNLYYPATPGWDYSTGLGTPNLWDFYLVLSNKLMAGNF